MQPIRACAIPFLFLISISGPAAALDLGAYKGCAATDADFKQTQIWKGPVVANSLTGNGALKVAFVSQPDASVDVYFIQKRGGVKRYNGKSGTVDSLGTIPVDNSRNEQGLVGLAVRKDFLKKPDLYVMYSSTEAGGTYSFRVARFSMNGGLSAVDLASENILIKIPRASEDWHTGGSMVFDDYGDLWGAVGDNKQTEKGPGNTADLRGGIYRIHPDDSPKGYSIPAGNFGPKMSAWFTTQGNAALAAQYLDTAKVKPEIYVKGTRNAYTITVDPVKRWLAWGDVGPDQGKVSEEHNLVKEPVFAGWPYFAGAEDMSLEGGNFYGPKIPAGSTRAAPLNQDPAALGVKQLPPVREPIFVRKTGCAMTGPILRYDGRIKAAGQFPPQLDGKWLNAGCDPWGMHLMTLDAGAEAVVGTPPAVFPSVSSGTLVDMKQGPDGALYYVLWGTGIYRLAYTGACKDESLVPPKNGCATAGAPGYDPTVPKEYHDPAQCGPGTAIAPQGAEARWLRLERNMLSVDAPGELDVRILDVNGRVVAELRGTGPMRFDLTFLPKGAVHEVRVRSASGTAVRRLPGM
jgi:glucose/arabinose dehydrogenase